MNKRLYRSRSDRFLGGVCGGLGHYLGIDPVIVRIVFLLLMIGQGIGVLLYIVLWILIPAEGAQESTPGSTGDRISEGMKGVGEDIRNATQAPNPQAGLWFGVALVILGSLLFIERLSEQFGWWWLQWVRLDNLWPVLLVVIGGALLWRGIRKGE